MNEVHEEQTMSASPKRWGAWATAGFSVLVIVLFIMVQIAVFALVVAIQVARNPDTNVAAYAESLGSSGLVLGIAAIATTIICGGLVLLLIVLRKGLSIREYLGFDPVSARSLLLWLAVALVTVFVLDGIRVGLGEPLVPEFMLNAYASAGFLPLLWLAIVVAAPLFEELLFRGFMLEGLRESRLGAWGAILITSGVWTVIHLQYGLVDMLVILVLGVLLGLAKVRTRSLLTPILIHIFVNLIATCETAWLHMRG